MAIVALPALPAAAPSLMVSVSASLGGGVSASVTAVGVSTLAASVAPVIVALGAAVGLGLVGVAIYQQSGRLVELLPQLSR